jgi:hypothetical protein
MVVRAAWGYTVENRDPGDPPGAEWRIRRHPRLKIVLGHLGETLPFLVWRIDQALALHLDEITTKVTAALIETVTIARTTPAHGGSGSSSPGGSTPSWARGLSRTVCGLVVAGARFVHSRHLAETDDHPLAFVFILPRLKVA